MKWLLLPHGQTLNLLVVFVGIYSSSVSSSVSDSDADKDILSCSKYAFILIFYKVLIIRINDRRDRCSTLYSNKTCF